MNSQIQRIFTDSAMRAGRPRRRGGMKYTDEFGAIRGVLSAMLLEGAVIAAVCVAWHAIAGGVF